ncbi:uncharacterized protein BP01DRAFT_79912 [Aspergillus saccharolyticus JOP 1030-1]|uniref:Uncharacterized protein n=1 Tax=Aspergillus saccharolyticus JOP 1030-1 TaxID=1450539 RepID=A0A318ZS60_9EURO|nr:hypothetical protein BP01DRAFT_79912 [Aspergillus saccharolyticus JOP 1030-1]PYH49525.1 hypothetical protein BP01DRAFT_79912 [Aspergillus saccharolyticus JOP 1030-1]
MGWKTGSPPVPGKETLTRSAMKIISSSLAIQKMVLRRLSDLDRSRGASLVTSRVPCCRALVSTAYLVTYLIWGNKLLQVRPVDMVNHALYLCNLNQINFAPSFPSPLIPQVGKPVNHSIPGISKEIPPLPTGPAGKDCTFTGRGP